MHHVLFPMQIRNNYLILLYRNYIIGILCIVSTMQQAQVTRTFNLKSGMENNLQMRNYTCVLCCMYEYIVPAFYINSIWLDSFHWLNSNRNNLKLILLLFIKNDNSLPPLFSLSSPLSY